MWENVSWTEETKVALFKSYFRKIRALQNRQSISQGKQYPLKYLLKNVTETWCYEPVSPLWKTPALIATKTVKGKAPDNEIFWLKYQQKG